MINPNQIQSFETWQEAFDGVKRAVDDYHMKFWEELEKMTKIEERKQYKFSEIIAMLENKELPAETVISMAGRDFGVGENMLGFMGLFDHSRFNQAKSLDVRITPHEINSLWTIKLPEEDKFYLKAPDAFKNGYLNLHLLNRYYLVNDENDTTTHQTQFTQKEIDTLPFDMNFFKKIKVEDKTND